MKTILIGILSIFVFFGSVSTAQGTETDIEAMNDMNRHHFNNHEYKASNLAGSELFAMEEIKKKKKGKKKKIKKGKKKKKGFFSKIFGSK